MERQIVSAEPAYHPVADGFGDCTFQLSLSGMPFGMFWSGPDGCSVRWPGALDFAKLNVEATVNLPQHLPHGDGRGAALVVLRFDDGKLSRFTLPKDAERCAEALVSAERVNFARYDLMSEHGLPFAAALTAENPASRPDQDGRLAILLPNARGWTAGLLEWIVDHHSLGHSVRPIIDFERSSALFAKLCSG